MFLSSLQVEGFQDHGRVMVLDGLLHSGTGKQGRTLVTESKQKVQGQTSSKSNFIPCPNFILCWSLLDTVRNGPRGVALKLLMC